MSQVVDLAHRVLRTGDPWQKAKLTQNLFADREGSEAEALPEASNSKVSSTSATDMVAPDMPARMEGLCIVPSSKMQKLGKGGSVTSRQLILHSLSHIECWAIDLSWDIIARFAISESMPVAFVVDFAGVARDEASHFEMLAQRLGELGSKYGAHPVHDGLWESATRTRQSLMARLAVEHCVHEARGLDVLPSTIAKFRKHGDDESADILEHTIYGEEISHCAAGLKWFAYLWVRGGPIHKQEVRNEPDDECFCSAFAGEDSEQKKQQCLDAVASWSCMVNRNGDGDGDCERESLEDVLERYGVDIDKLIESFHFHVRKYFHGNLKPPFNHEARAKAGFTAKWYEPLAE